MKRIIFLGLPKCATVSLTAAFDNLGYRSAHWGDEKGAFGPRILAALGRGEKILSPLENDYNVFTQLDYCSPKEGFCFFPQNSLHEILYRDYPDAYFILNYRPVQDHVRSMKNWYDFAERLAYFGITDLEKFITFHNERVSRYFQKRTRFLKYDIQNDKEAKMEKFLDLTGIVIPHLNPDPYAHA